MKSISVIVHIGTEKTGSTAIQRSIQTNLDRLHSQGAFFLKSCGAFNHMQLTAYCLDNHKPYQLFERKPRKWKAASQRDLFRTRLEEAASEEVASLPDRTRALLFSCEHFHSRLTDLDEIQRLKSFVEKICDQNHYSPDFKVVVYFRPQADLIQSQYSTHLRSGGVQTFDEFQLRCHPDNYYYNHFAIYRHWSRVFGERNIYVGAYERQRLLGQDIRRDFFSRASLDSTGFIFDDKVDNPSISRFGLWGVRMVNRWFGPISHGNQKAWAKRKKVQAWVIKYSGHRPANLLKQAQREEIHRKFLASNTLLVEHLDKVNEDRSGQRVQSE